MDAEHVYYTPATFGPAQRITLTPQPDEDSPKLGLFYTPDEFNKAVSLLTINKYNEEFTINEEAVNYLYELTNRHPGGVTALVDFLQSVYTVLDSTPEYKQISFRLNYTTNSSLGASP